MPTNASLAVNDPDILLNKIKLEFPSLKWSSYSYVDYGFDHEVIILDDKYVFRFPNSVEYRDILRDEVGLLAFLCRYIETPIPDYKFVSRDYSFGGYKLLRGVELTERRFEKLNDKCTEILAAGIAKFLTQLHSLTSEQLKPYNIPIQKPFGGYNDLDEESKGVLEKNLSKDVYHEVKLLKQSIEKNLTDEVPPVLTHGDIAPKHIIWDEKVGTPAIIDFSDRSMADPAIDFAELYTYGADFAEAVYRQYAGPKDETFQLRAKAYFKSVSLHMLIHSFQTDKVEYDDAKHIFDLAKNL